MFADFRKHVVASILAMLVGILAPGFAFASDSSEQWTTRFLSPDGVPLPSNWRANPEAWTLFVIHGFRDKGTSAPCLRQADAILQRFPRANVIIVDWKVPPKPHLQYGANKVFLLESITAIASEYSWAVKASKRVGSDIAEWMKKKGISPSRTIVSGHSLGGQIAAFASNESAKPDMFGEPVDTIIAADPAGPFFESKPSEKRLDKTDAREIIVVHTSELFGDENAIGTVDIYVSWPESDTADYIAQHNQARELVTESFLKPEMSNTDGTPFGANAIGFEFSDDKPLTFQPNTQQKTNLALHK